MIVGGNGDLGQSSVLDIRFSEVRFSALFRLSEVRLSADFRYLMSDNLISDNLQKQKRPPLRAALVFLTLDSRGLV